MSIKVIIGLGNIGEAYKNTRHNIGFMILDALAESSSILSSWKKNVKLKAKIAKVSINGEAILLVKPNTYMNLSGQCVGALKRFYKFTDDALVVVYDDIGIDFPRVKLSVGGSAGGHNGIKDIQAVLGSNAPFVRYRFGIHTEDRVGKIEQNLSDYVLQRFTEAEMTQISAQMTKNVADLKLLVDKGVTEAMNLVNQKDRKND